MTNLKIVFVSNYMNHHQMPFCNEMYRMLGDGFSFIQTETIGEHRIKLGWVVGDMPSYVKSTYTSKEDYIKCIKLIDEADVAIIGSVSDEFVQNRFDNNQIVVRYAERIFKEGMWKFFKPTGARSRYNTFASHRKDNFYVLCASAYMPCDLQLYGFPKDRLYKWGYFPEFIEYDEMKLIESKRKAIIELLWCGRFIDWKHAEKAIEVVYRLKSNGYKAHLNMIGTGELLESVKKLALDRGVLDSVTFAGSMKPEEVRHYMETADIYLFTSDYNEGWGAVLNESMNSGCAVVASHAIGSVPYLISNGINGLVYRNNSIDQLYYCVESLISDSEYREKLQLNAYYTIKNVWNPKVAARNLLQFCSDIFMHKSVDIVEGPCSKATMIRQGKMYKEITNNNVK